MSSAPGTVNITYQAHGLQAIQAQYDAYLAYVKTHQPGVTFGNAGSASGPSYGPTGSSPATSATPAITPAMRRMETAQARMAVTMEQQAVMMEAQVRTVAAGARRPAGGGAGGRGGGGFGGGFIFSPIGALFGAWEVSQAVAGVAKAELQGSLAENMGGVYKAKQAKLDAIYSGLMMGMTGLGLDALGWATGTNIGPTARREQFQVMQAAEESRLQSSAMYRQSAAAAGQRAAYGDALGTGNLTSAQREYQRSGISQSGSMKAAEVTEQIKGLEDVNKTMLGEGSWSTTQLDAWRVNLGKIAAFRAKIPEIAEQTKFELDRFKALDEQDTRLQTTQLQGQALVSQAMAQRNPYLAAKERITTSLATAMEGKPELIPQAIATHAAAYLENEANYDFEATQQILASQGAASISRQLAEGRPFSAQIRAIEARQKTRLAGVLEGPRADEVRRGIVNESWAERDAARADWQRDSILSGARLGAQNQALALQGQTNDPLRGLKAQAGATASSAIIDAYKAQISQHPELIGQILTGGKLDLESQRQSFKDRFRAEEAQIGRIATTGAGAADPTEVMKSIDEAIRQLIELQKNPTKLIEAIKALGETK